MIICEYWVQQEVANADAKFDGGEFSSAFHAHILETLNPCGECETCREAERFNAENLDG